ncbi:MAG: sulfotransferase [Pirellulales bacterium]
MCQQSTTLPDVFVVGAAKSGTTAIHQYFRAHPQVFVPGTIKETNYMAFFDGLPRLAGPRDAQVLEGSITNLAAYRALYAARSCEAAAVDVSPAYLYYPQAPAKIAELCPRAKIVIVLRNPAEAAFSMYAMMRRDRRERCGQFWRAFEQSSLRIAAGWEWAWDYQGCFRYAPQVARYLDRFPASQLFIRRYEELRDTPEQFYGALAQFLEISPIDLRQANRPWNVAPPRHAEPKPRRTIAVARGAFHSLVDAAVLARSAARGAGSPGTGP